MGGVNIIVLAMPTLLRYTGSMAKTSYHHGGLREALLKEAFKVLEEQGLEALSLRELAEKTGVSKNAPYRHFASRQDLLANLAADGFREFADDMEGAVRALDPNTFPTPLSYSLECLRAIFRVYLRFARKRPACYRLMFSELGYSLHSESCRSNSMRAFGVLTDTVGRAHHNGWRNLEDPQGLSLQIWATVHGWASIINDRLLPEDLSEAVDYPLEDLLFAGD